MRNQFFACLALMAGSAMFFRPLAAHHGSTSYRTDKLVVLKQATVTRFLWANPHAMLMFDVRDENGNLSHWAGEAGSPAAVRLMGWNKNSLQPGDVITVQLYLSKFEPNAGRVDAIVMASGVTLKNSPRGDRGDATRY